MPAPRVSAVIPVYNGEPYIRQAIQSLLTQTFRQLEVIVIDDGSVDATTAVVEEMAHSDPRVRLYRGEHRGAIACFNFGAAEVRGEYIAWLGADDVSVPTRITRQVELLDARPSIALVGGGLVATDEVLRPRLFVGYPTEDAAIRALLPTSNPIAAPAALIRAAVYTAIGGVRPAFVGGAEDYDLWLRIAESHELANVSGPVVYYRVHSGQVSQTRKKQMILSMVGAQVAAQRRKSGRPDGLDGRNEITHELLLELEPERPRLNEAILSTAAGHATFLALLGNSAGALDLLSWAEATSAGTRLARYTRARAFAVRALVGWKKRDAWAVLGAGASAFALSPHYVLSSIVKGADNSIRLFARRLVGPRERTHTTFYGVPQKKDRVEPHQERSVAEGNLIPEGTPREQT